MQRGYYSCFSIRQLNMNIIQNNKRGKPKQPILVQTNTETGTITHKHTVKPRLPKYDSQSETTNDTCL